MTKTKPVLYILEYYLSTSTSKITVSKMFNGKTFVICLQVIIKFVSMTILTDNHPETTFYAR